MQLSTQMTNMDCFRKYFELSSLLSERISFIAEGQCYFQFYNSLMFTVINSGSSGDRVKRTIIPPTCYGED